MIPFDTIRNDTLAIAVTSEAMSRFVDTVNISRSIFLF